MWGEVQQGGHNIRWQEQNMLGIYSSSGQQVGISILEQKYQEIFCMETFFKILTYWQVRRAIRKIILCGEQDIFVINYYSSEYNQ